MVVSYRPITPIIHEGEDGEPLSKNFSFSRKLIEEHKRVGCRGACGFARENRPDKITAAFAKAEESNE
jgi:hypothetical protein